ncbi:hypothetical protein [Collimonas humicola]|uniref:hypothetical protein n=1 Tax=Collimonas humicola TaxID=2825886 RepID=UPI001B8C2DE0|nr:hypothetical protein [Collimonas humicola]
MSSLACTCGHIIRDITNNLPHRGSLFKGILQDNFFDWLIHETQSYVVAVQQDQVRQWLLEKGYGEDYANLCLDHGNVLHDHIHNRYLEIKRDVFECQACGRIHIETTDNQFASFTPEIKNDNRIFAKTFDGGGE